MNETKKNKGEVLTTELKCLKRSKNIDKDYVNVYIYIDGHRFELVPHCRTPKETAYFYKLLKDSNLIDFD